ncbi:apoptosis antagonizing transcription factor [Anticarsia gemmatalis]|uniref:apoptosis antagonizing transcription factor n=1 Tax=Anticarsia gemmatalis TaxID=129554 RepID=UPI003F775780
MKIKQKKSTKKLLSDKIADALTVKPRADIEDDQVFGTKPKTVSKDDIGSSDSEVEAAISDFRKRNVNLLSEVSKKYEGQVVSRKDLKKSDEDESEDEEITSEEELSDTNKEQISLHSEGSDSEEEVPTLKSTTKDSEESDDSGSDAESEDYSITQFKKQLYDNSDDDAEDGSEEEDGEEDEEDDDEGEGYDISQMDEPMKETFEHVKKQNISEEAKKGNAVRNQLLLWEGLLEMRIHLQRCMNTANQMPMPEVYNELKENESFQEDTNATKANIANVLDKLLTLQNLLLTKYPETKGICSKKQSKQAEAQQTAKEESDEEIPSDTDNEEIPSDTDAEDEAPTKTKTPTKTIPTKKRKLEEYESEISTTHKAFKSFRDTSIQKWNDKTRLATATNIKNAPTNTVLQQISYILSDREKLVRRTQLKRSEYDIIGYKKEVTEENNDNNGTEVNPITRDRKDNDEYIPEIFDDSDFYHQLLRELIECKSADISDPVQLSRQWIALQQMRSKMKRKVDTKATKGRKIKYVVHNQLVNFMAPEKSVSWTDESKNELYSSLFGKLFEQNNVGLNANVNGFKLKD